MNRCELFRHVAVIFGLLLCSTVAGEDGPKEMPEWGGEDGWALWDAEGQHLAMAEILAIHRDFGSNVYFFRYETRHGLDLGQLKAAGMFTIKVAHPGYAPFNQPEFINDENQVRTWAREAAKNPDIDGLALDMEGSTATSHKHLLRWLGEEAHAEGKSMHVVPHFALFDRWDDTLTPAEINTHCDVVWPWLYNRFRKDTYSEGLLAMLAYWKEKGVTVPTYPIFDHGRTSYSGITPVEAAQVPKLLREAGVKSLCLFQPHASYRAREVEPQFMVLWDGLGKYNSG